MLAAPVTMRQFELFYANNVEVPVDFIYARPFHAVQTEGVLFMARGEDTCELLYMHASAGVERDVAAKELRIFFDFRGAPLIRDSTKIMYLPDVRITADLGGNTLVPFSPESFKNRTDELDDASPSLFVLMVPYGSTSEDVLPVSFDIRGFYSKDVTSFPMTSEGLARASELHYPSALFYNKAFGFDKSILPLAAESRARLNGVSTMPLNGVMMRTGQYEYNHATGKHDHIRVGHCHMGTDYDQWSYSYLSGQAIGATRGSKAITMM